MDGVFGPLYSYGVKVLLNLYNHNGFVAENVGGLRNANDGKAFTKILDELKKAGKYGYTVTHTYTNLKNMVFHKHAINYYRRHPKRYQLVHTVYHPQHHADIDNTCEKQLKNRLFLYDALNND